MRFNKLYEKKAHPEQTAVSSGVQTLGTDQWMGTYKFSKDVAGHDGDKQHAPESPSGNDVYTDKPIVVGYSDADDKMTKAVMNGKVKQTVGSGSEEPENVNAKSPLSKNEDVSKGLPDHLKKHFDKDGNPIKGSWKDGKWTPNKDPEYQVKDVTPKGYGPTEDVEEAQNIYHLNRTGFARGPRDSERHDLDVSRTSPQEWALKINGKVWSKDGKTVTFNSKEQALKVRQSLLAKRPELEVGLVTRGGTTEAQGDIDVDTYADALIKRDKQNLSKRNVAHAARIAGVDEKKLLTAIQLKVGRIKEEADLDEDVGAEIADLIRKKNSASSPVARRNIDSQIAQLKRQRDKLNEFAPGDGGDGGEEDALHNYAKMWYNGDDSVQQQVEQILARSGWEIGELESEEGGAFVVQSGDEHGDSYIGFTAADLTEGVEEAHGNSKIYDKCWTGYRKVPGKKRGEDGSCEKIKEDTVDEDVIYRLDKENPMNDTEVLVIGGAGRYSLDGLRNKARKEVEQLAKDLAIDHGGAFRRSAQNVRQLQNTLNTIVAAYDELNQLRKLGGMRSKGIKDEDATVMREGVELMEKWTQKYKNSINCSDPKGFSQKAHCASKKK
jgi:hypothetical protein